VRFSDLFLPIGLMAGFDNFTFLDSSMVAIPSSRVAQKQCTLHAFTV
jgi:hypothetical protein